MDAISLLTEFITDVADLEFTPICFSIIASNPYLRFTTILYISKIFCVDFGINQSLNASISLPSLSDAITAADGAHFETIAISFKAPDQMVLTFETSTPSGRVPHFHQNLMLLSPQRLHLDKPVDTIFPH
ncbi:hypothetical protein SDJN03_17406, partial [Cucurbita argyrosperma subsp. sororia]